MKPSHPPGEDAPAMEVGAAAFRARLLQSFARVFGEPASHLTVSPGRVNLLGEHTDYNEGFVLPMAIDRSVWIALRARQDRRVRVVSLDYGEEADFGLDELQRHEGSWSEYLKGTAWAMQEAGQRLRGWEGVLAGQVPIGAGLSSSAALEIAAARAFAAVSDLGWEPLTAARWGQRAENGWVGVQCGIMDPLIVATAREGQALLVDCRNLRMVPKSLPPRTVVAVLDTSTRRGLTQSAYNDRRTLCEEAARRLGVRSLRDVTAAELDVRLPELPADLQRLVRHVVTENARTLAAAESNGDPARFGALMTESHASLRDDFAVSSEALDAMALSAQEVEGCYGARMTGAGFGGCVVGLVDAAASTEFAPEALAAYRRRTGLEGVVYLCRPSGGASVEFLR